MTSPEVEFAVVLTIDFKLKVSPYTVTTRYFSQSGYEDNEIEDNGTGFKAYGLIRNISGLGSSCESEIPTNRTGAITLDNTRGSTGHNLRFSDWLDKEEIIAQSVEVRYAIAEPSGTLDIDGNTEFVGKVLRVRIDPKSNTINVDVVCNYFDISFPQYQINLTDWPSAPSRSIGLYLPVILGSAIVPAYLVASGSTQTSYLYQSGNSTYAPGGHTQIYAKDSSGEYCEVISVTPTDTAKIFDNDLDGSEDAGPGGANSWDIFSQVGLAFKLVHSSSTNYVLTSGFIYYYDTTASASGSWTFSIWEGDSDGNLSKEIVRTTRVKDDFTFNGDNSKDKVEFTFPRPVVLNPAKEYFFSQTQTGDILVPVRDSATTIEMWGREGDSWWNIQNTPFASGEKVFYAFRGIHFSELITSDYCKVIADLAAVSGLSDADVTTLNLLIKATGLQDTPFGALTGTANLDLGTSAAYCIAALATNTELTTYGPETLWTTDYPRRIDGATKGRSSIVDICAQICRANILKVVARRSGSLAIWGYGRAQSSAVTITEDNCTLNSIDIPGTESIVNMIDIAYAETAIPLNVEDLQTGQPRSFEETLSLAYNTNGETAASSTDSYNLYGNRELNTGYVSLPYIRDDTSAAFFAKYAMTVYAAPRKTAELTIPFLGLGYDTLELMDLITLCHIDMPSEYGTSAEGKTPFPVESGIVNTEVNSSYMWHQAKAYTCRIVTRKVNFNLDKGEMPTLDLEVQILDNPMEVR